MFLTLRQTSNLHGLFRYFNAFNERRVCFDLETSTSYHIGRRVIPAIIVIIDNHYVLQYNNMLIFLNRLRFSVSSFLLFSILYALIKCVVLLQKKKKKNPRAETLFRISSLLCVYQLLLRTSRRLYFLNCARFVSISLIHSYFNSSGKCCWLYIKLLGCSCYPHEMENRHSTSEVSVKTVIGML